MASQLLRTALAGAALTAACLWPAEYYLVPEPMNSPPVIDTFAVVPESDDDGRVLWDPETMQGLEFELRSVTDLDVADTLYVTWHVGYVQGHVSLDREWGGGVQSIPPGTTPRRPVVRFTLTEAITDSIDTSRGIGTEPNPDAGVATRPYVVEALVSDRQPTGTAGNQYPEGAYVARWRWIVVIASTGGG